jgi:hypothetical protein
MIWNFIAESMVSSSPGLRAENFLERRSRDIFGRLQRARNIKRRPAAETCRADITAMSAARERG